jgi:hypothetical protein
MVYTARRLLDQPAMHPRETCQLAAVVDLTPEPPASLPRSLGLRHSAVRCVTQSPIGGGKRRRGAMRVVDLCQPAINFCHRN